MLRRARQRLLLPLELLQQVGLEVGAAGDIEDLEQRQQRGVVLERVVLAGEEVHALVQVLQAQQGADALVQRELVADHSAVRARRRLELRSVLPKSTRKIN